jgi:4-hydroxythreonine-4-phosphate dehydrogenase
VESAVNRSQPLVVTSGEPAGVGPELCLALATADIGTKIVVLSDPVLLRLRAEQIGVKVSIREIDRNDVGRCGAGRGELLVIGVRYPAAPECGIPNPANAEAILETLRLAAAGCLDGSFAGLVTAPVQKSVINDAGFEFTGHTEFLADLTGSKYPVMLLVADQLRVALATTHLPLRDVASRLTRSVLRDVVQTLYTGLQKSFRIESPEIVVCGLNPHAGEGGHLGSEDAEIIAPVLEEFRARGINVRGPLPADTAFLASAGHRDAVLAMYHDQGLPVLKYAGFGHAVNVTLGLPIVRTSVDHGTALDIAGTGKADPGSLLAAVRLAAELASPK